MRPLAHETLKSLRDYYRVGLTYSSNAPEMTRALLKGFSDSGKIEFKGASKNSGYYLK